MSAKDRSGFYQAGAKALKILAAGCGEARLAQVFENQAERFMLMAKTAGKTCDQPMIAAPVVTLVPAKRPSFSPRGIPSVRSVTGHTAQVVHLSAARERRDG